MNLDILQIIVPAITMLIIAAATISSQWLLELRRERKVRPTENPDSQNIIKVVLKELIDFRFCVIFISLCLLIIFPMVGKTFSPIKWVEAFLMCIQISILCSWVVAAFLITYHGITVRYMLTGNLTSRR